MNSHKKTKCGKQGEKIVKNVDKKKIYKEPIKSEMETNINVIYSENIFEIYTNNISLQKQLNRLIGTPTEEYKIKRSIAGSKWRISLDDQSKINKIVLRAKIFDMQEENK